MRLKAMGKFAVMMATNVSRMAHLLPTTGPSLGTWGTQVSMAVRLKGEQRSGRKKKGGGDSLW
jgi:hypothetical protein